MAENTVVQIRTPERAYWQDYSRTTLREAAAGVRRLTSADREFRGVCWISGKVVVDTSGRVGQQRAPQQLLRQVPVLQRPLPLVGTPRDS